MLLKLFLLFTVIPAMELWLIIKVGSSIGAMPTLALLILSGFIGAYCARMQGLSVIRRFSESVSKGEAPAETLLDGLLVVIGGVMMITPGFITDAVGLILVTPAGRKIVKPFVAAWLKKRITAHVVYPGGAAGFGGFGPSAGPRRNDDDVIDV